MALLRTLKVSLVVQDFLPIKRKQYRQAYNGGMLQQGGRLKNQDFFLQAQTTWHLPAGGGGGGGADFC